MDANTLSYVTQEVEKAQGLAKKDGYPCFVMFDSAILDDLLAELTLLRAVAAAGKWVRTNHDLERRRDSPCRCHLCAALAALDACREGER